MALRLGTATLCRPVWAQVKASSPLVQTGWISSVSHPVELGELEKIINSNSCIDYGDEMSSFTSLVVGLVQSVCILYDSLIKKGHYSPCCSMPWLSPSWTRISAQTKHLMT